MPSKQTIEEEPVLEVSRRLPLLFRAITMIVHGFSLVLCAFLAYVAKPGSSLFSWHPVLMSIGFGFIMFEAILLISTQHSFLQILSRSQRVTVHWIMQAIAVTVILVGFIVIFINKNINDKPHFKTWHGTMGLITVLLSCGLPLGGVLINFPSLRPTAVRLSTLKLGHSMGGVLCFLLSCTTMILGMFSNWLGGIVPGPVQFALAVIPLALATTVAIQVVREYLPRLRRL